MKSETDWAACAGPEAFIWGGQSLAQIYLESSENAVFGNHSLYAAELDTLFKEAMNRYIVEDEDLEDALEEFYEMVEDVFPDIEIDD